MSLKREPKFEHGFIYILSNPSMVNVYKVGLTTNSIRQRIRELSTTGVPRPFVAEKVFEVPASKLREIEKLAHKKLKKKDLHHGKEFFEGGLGDCVKAVEDAIYEVTKSDSFDLVGAAKIRAITEMESRRALQREIELENIRTLEIERLVSESNRSVDDARRKFIENIKSLKSKEDTFLEKYVFIPLGLIFFGGVALAVMVGGGPLAWIGIPVFVWWLIGNHNDELRVRHEAEAAQLFPYNTVETFRKKSLIRNEMGAALDSPCNSGGYQKKNEGLMTSNVSKMDSVKVQEGDILEAAVNASVDKNICDHQMMVGVLEGDVLKKRNSEISSIQEIEALGWVVNSGKTILCNRDKGIFLTTKSGLGFSISGGYFILHNQVRQRKISVENTPVDDDAVARAERDLSA